MLNVNLYRKEFNYRQDHPIQNGKFRVYSQCTQNATSIDRVANLYQHEFNNRGKRSSNPNLLIHVIYLKTPQGSNCPIFLNTQLLPNIQLSRIQGFKSQPRSRLQLCFVKTLHIGDKCHEPKNLDVEAKIIVMNCSFKTLITIISIAHFNILQFDYHDFMTQTTMPMCTLTAELVNDNNHQMIKSHMKDHQITRHNTIDHNNNNESQDSITSEDQIAPSLSTPSYFPISNYHKIKDLNCSFSKNLDHDHLSYSSQRCNHQFMTETSTTIY